MHLTHKQLLLAPTDLSNFHSCRHLPSLDLRVARGEAQRPARYGPVIDELKARGHAHEAAYREHLQTSGLNVVSVDDGPDGSAAQRTYALLQRGVDVVCQGTLADGHWAGRADFLMKVDSPSDLGDWSYEVTDTKLARDTKAGTILQLCAYTCLLGKLQGRVPAWMHVVTPGSNFVPLDYRVDDFGAYFRLLERDLAGFVSQPGETYPELVAHCDFCAWWSECEGRRRADDHLCYVANISSAQIRSLRELGVTRLEELALLDEVPEPARGSREALVRARDQARLQREGRRKSACCYELREPFDENHGLALLPAPTPDDMFLDFEGNHFVEDGVQEYLAGYLAPDDAGAHCYTALWAHTQRQEQQAFETFMDTVEATLNRNPDAHVYHFAPYEPVALKRLMGRYATREGLLDRLLRGGVFVDLYAAVRRGLIASVERYSIKDLEPFFGFDREQDLREASFSRRVIETAIETEGAQLVWDGALARHRRIVEDYNREDCLSARRLRDWLEHLRSDAIAAGHDLPRPPRPAADASDEVSELDARLHALRDALLAEVPVDRAQRGDEQQARFLLAHMLEFHRRESKATWWEYFRVLDLETGDYEQERRAIRGLVFSEVLEDSAAPLQRYRFAPQELDARRRDNVYDANGDRVGGISNVSFADGVVDIKKTRASADYHPAHVVLHNRVDANVLQESLIRLGQAVLADGFTPRAPYRAAFELLLRAPIGNGDPLQDEDESTLDAACRLALALDGGVLAIQGPPGTGKTFTGAHMICALRQAGLRVGVTAVSHQVILNLMEGACELAAERGIGLQAVHRQSGSYEGKWAIERVLSYDAILGGLAQGGIDLLGATAWAWARPGFAGSVDVLIVDEAGQMSLSNVLATAQAGRSLVLLGDPRQLEQPLQCNHPEGTEISALHHLLGGADTMPPDKGLFLGETYRLHPDIAAFTSEVYYESKLRARPGLDRQAVLGATRFTGSGLRYVPVVHAGNQGRALEEVEVIAGIVAGLTGTDLRWRDKDDLEHPLARDDILIIAPYNAQVSALSERLPGCRIGTVDRFQGQEAPVVIYSMTSSSSQDAPRGMEFLYNPNRFNVATSRARALCIAVGSPALFEPECRSPRQLKMANGFCRFLELATTVPPDG